MSLLIDQSWVANWVATPMTTDDAEELHHQLSRLKKPDHHQLALALPMFAIVTGVHPLDANSIYRIPFPGTYAAVVGYQPDADAVDIRQQPDGPSVCVFRKELRLVRFGRQVTAGAVRRLLQEIHHHV